MSASRIVLLGPPGSGKGTQSEHIQKKLGIVAISTGDMFREAQRKQTSLGLEMKKYMDAGELVPDDVVLGLVEQRLALDDCANGYILDGFPRTIPQAEQLAEKVTLDLVLEIHCDFERIVERLSGRRIHPTSGRIYHIVSNPPQKDGIDDVTGEPLEYRIDDHENTVRNRLDIYQQQTAALIDYYSKPESGVRFVSIDGDRVIAEVTQDILATLD